MASEQTRIRWSPRHAFATFGRAALGLHMSFFTELHRRNVVRVAVAYTVTAWLILQVADVVMENIGAPPWVMQALLFLLAVGLIAALIFAWVFELTPEGIKLETEVPDGASVVGQTRRKLDTVIIVLLVSAVAYLFWDGRMREPAAESQAPVVAGVGSVEQEVASLAKLREQGNAQPAGAQDSSIAVLPFVNLSSDPEQEYFSDGISEELLNVLAQIPSLRVAARTSSFQFKGDNRDISEIAELLKVNHVLEGSVRKAGTRLRITAQLIAAESGYHLWSETYDRELADVFAIQDEISLAIADALRAELALDADSRPLASRDTTNTPAYEAFLKGRALINQRGNEAVTEGVRELERSVLLDPSFAPARAQLAIGITLLAATSGTYGDLTIEEVDARASEQIAAAASIDDDFAELWAARAILANIKQDTTKTLEYADRALALRPNYADPLNWRINAFAELGDVKAALAARERLLELDPLSVIGRLNAAGNLAFSEPERALVLAQSIAPQSAWASHVAQARVHRATGRHRQQLEQLLLAYALSPSDLLVNFDMASEFVAVGMVDEALRLSRTIRPWVLMSVGRQAEAEVALRRMHAADPQDLEVVSALADSLYFQGRYEEAAAFWATAVIPTVHGDVVYSNGGNVSTLRYAFSLQALSEGTAAASFIQSVESLQREREAIWSPHRYSELARAAIALLKQDIPGALRHLQEADRLGLRSFEIDNPDEAILAPLRETPEFQVILENAGQRKAENREALLRLICENNPVPDNWRPLEATCASI
ncbi:MAG: hypothetical protein Cons2KO_11070 [Congregibacter sp.]